MLVRTVTWTTSRDAQWGNYVHTTFYDGQGFMVSEVRWGVSSASELSGASVCVTAGHHDRAEHVRLLPAEQPGVQPQGVRGHQRGCLTPTRKASARSSRTDRSQLAALRSALPNPDEHVILPETISEEPLGPVVPHGDEQWFDLVKTVVSGLIYARGLRDQQRQRVADGLRRQREGEASARYGGQLWPGGPGAVEYVHAGRGSRPWATTARSTIATWGAGGIDLPREGGRNALWANAPCTDCPKGGQIYAPPLR